MTNPLLEPWTAPYGLPPFSQVRPEHYSPAFAQAMREHRAEVDVLGNATSEPTFANTIAAFDRAGRSLDRIAGMFYNLTSSETSPALQEVERDLAPKLSAHNSAVHMHEGLFARIDALHAKRAELGLGDEERRVLERFHTDFVRSGAKLAPAQQAPLCRSDAAPGGADHALRPERAGRRIGLPTGAQRRGRAGRLAAIRAGGSATGRGRQRHSRRLPRDAVALAHRSVPDVL